MCNPSLWGNTRSPEDYFDCYHSSARITVECVFGEINMRWRIFWNPLACSLNHVAIIIEGTMSLHKYVVEYRDTDFPPSGTDIERHIFQDNCTNSTKCPIIAGNNNTRHSVRPSNDNRDQRLKGLRLRDKLRLALKDHELYHPRKEEWDYDKNMTIIRYNEQE